MFCELELGVIGEFWGGWGRWLGGLEGIGVGRRGRLLEKLEVIGVGGRGRYLIGEDSNGVGKKVFGRVEGIEGGIGRVWGWWVGEIVG